ncbi:DUF4350 domain-containing protein [Herbidospora sp. NBRC 101105]|uniref:DUF4350 domain-containing protein n=1 Tax=Herbidospora sp. NBRC 101105 TaxID=3032195 RepID=UPI0024A4467B|nr:DUF4350 domain-containing protein [Herbidospora sp. NBRC 101105]GLX98488.1 membrane protein [Herbidospora sp. NBRC 101105]
MTSITPTITDRWRSWRGVLGALGLIVLAATLIVLLGGSRNGGRLDIEATTPWGARALAELLRAQGVEVNQVTTFDDAVEQAEGSLLVVARPEFLADPARLAELVGRPGARLLIAPTEPVLRALAPGVTAFPGSPETVRKPGCGLRAAVLAGDALVGGSTFTDATCYGGTVAVVGDTTLVASGSFLTNGRLAENGNAALAMNLAGTHQRVTWFAPRAPLGAPEGGEKSIEQLIPANVGWFTWALVLAVLLTALWRGRRLGPVVEERLPVVVRAAETVEGRGRLYRARAARDRAALALREAALARMTPRLGLTATAGENEIVTAVAARTGQDDGQVRRTLYGDAPGGDAALVALARDLDTIERQVLDS